MFKKILLTSILAVSSISSFAGTLTVDLYRGGNASTPRMDNVRVNDVTIYQGKDGTEWVKSIKSPANQAQGISTFSVSQKIKNEWKIAKNESYPSGLVVIRTHGNHYVWAPAYDMPKTEYVKLLKSVETKFKKVN